jgi:trehalose 6-phosphate synthase
VADAIQAALTMPHAERCDRHQSMLETLRKNDIHAWHTRFLRRLESSARTRVHKTERAIALNI